MKYILFITIGLAISSCCYIPMVDCGPKIVELNVSPAKVALGIGTDRAIDFSSWQYYSRSAHEPLLLHICCKVMKSDSILIKDASPLVKDDTLMKFKEIALLAEENIEGIDIQTFNIEFSNCCKNYPLEVHLDSIPIVMNADTSYASLAVRITR